MEGQSLAKKELQNTKSMRAADIVKDQIAGISAVVKMNGLAINSMSESLKNMASDFDKVSSLVTELQFRVVALTKLTGLAQDVIERATDDVKASAYNERLAQIEKEEGAVPAEKITETSAVVMTSKTDKPEVRGYFRTRFRLAELKDPAFKSGLLGKAVGDTLDHVLDGVTHTFTILDIKEVPAKTGASDEEKATG